MTHYPLVLNDGGRNLSKRPGSYSDCTVRALAIVTGTSYDSVYDLLAAAGRKPCAGFDSTSWIRRRRGRVLGGRFRAVPVRREMTEVLEGGATKRVMWNVTPTTFSLFYPEGRYLLETPSHTWVCLSSIHHDLWRVKEQPLSGAWVFEHAVDA